MFVFYFVAFIYLFICFVFFSIENNIPQIESNNKITSLPLFPTSEKKVIQWNTLQFVLFFSEQMYEEEGLWKQNDSRERGTKKWG